MSAHLPSFSRSLLITVVLSPLALAACSTTGGAPVESLALSFPEDPVLPETVAFVPTPSSGAEIALADAGDAETKLALGVSSYAPAPAPDTRFGPATVAARSPELDALIARYAEHYELPVGFVRRVVKRESTFNPLAYNNGHWGLMQIKHATARGMGYDGPAKGLLDAETNLKYAVRYLRGAWLVADGDEARADRLYQRGYYYDAKRRGMLEATGLGKDRRRARRTAPAPTPEVLPVAAPTPEAMPGVTPETMPAFAPDA